MAEYKNINELFQYWENNSYPEYVCGIWSNDGSIDNLTVAVNTESAKDEILGLIEDDSSVSFEYQVYSKNHLLSIIDEMNSRFCKSEYSKETGFLCMGLNEYENCVKITFNEEKIQYPATTELVSELEERFGDAVSIDYSEEIFICTEDLVAHTGMSTISYAPKSSSAEVSDGNFVMSCIILFLSVLILLSSLILQRRRALKTVRGEVIMSPSYSRKEIKRAVKECTVSVSPELDKRIMEMLDE